MRNGRETGSAKYDRLSRVSLRYEVLLCFCLFCGFPTGTRCAGPRGAIGGHIPPRAPLDSLSSPGNSHSRASAPCDSRHSAYRHPPQAAVGSSPLGAAISFGLPVMILPAALAKIRPGNSHSRASAPCDSRRSACLFRSLSAAGFSPGGRQLRWLCSFLHRFAP